MSVTRARGPLSIAPFRRALLGRMVSTGGSWMQIVAAGWLIYDLTGSSVAVGILTALSRGPALFLATPGGMLADRFDRRHVAAGMYTVQLVAAGILAALAWDGTVSPLEIYVLTAVMGCAYALGNPAILVATNSTVPRSLYRRATSLSALTASTARVIGPSVGGLVLNALGPGPCFAANAASFAVVVAALLSLPASAGGGERKPGSHGLMHAFAIVRARPVVLGILLGTAVFATLAAPLQELAPAIAKRVDEGAHILGFMLGALAIGGMIGSVLVRRFDQSSIKRHQLIGGGMAGCGLAIGLLALETTLPIDLFALAICGALWQVVYVETLAGAQLETPSGETGRVVGLYYTVFIGGLTLGALGLGALFDWLGIAEGLLMASIGLTAAGVIRIFTQALTDSGSA
jgi:predicted MFS family arabinose efflux permease